MHVTYVYICGECQGEYEEEDDARDCCDDEHGGAERLAQRIARRELEAAGQLRLGLEA